MATIYGLTKERMLEIAGASIVSARLSGSNLILTNRDGTDFNVGSVKGPKGDTGAAGTGGGSAANQVEYTGTAWPVDPTPTARTDWYSTKHASAPKPPNMKVGDIWIGLGTASL